MQLHQMGIYTRTAAFKYQHLGVEYLSKENFCGQVLGDNSSSMDQQCTGPVITALKGDLVSVLLTRIICSVNYTVRAAGLSFQSSLNLSLNSSLETLVNVPNHCVLISNS